MDRKKRSQIISSALGLLLGGAFLYFTFRRTDIAEVGDHLAAVSLQDVAVLVLLSLLMLVMRGVRWWMLFPEPRHPGELYASTRAVAVSYGVNNVAGRIGELVRVALFKHDTGRELGTTAATLVADRLVFDMLPFAFMFGGVVFAFREEAAAVSPHVEAGFPLFLALVLLGLPALAVLALAPQLIKRVLRALGLPRFPAVWRKVDTLISELAAGLSVVMHPVSFLKTFAFNLLIWATVVLYFYLSVRSFNIPLGLGQLFLVFTVSSLGALIPVPGGVGAVHFFMTSALVLFVGAEQNSAAACAAYSHGVNFLFLTLAAVVLWLLPRPVQRPETGETGEVVSP